MTPERPLRSRWTRSKLFIAATLAEVSGERVGWRERDGGRVIHTFYLGLSFSLSAHRIIFQASAVSIKPN